MTEKKFNIITDIKDGKEIGNDYDLDNAESLNKEDMLYYDKFNQYAETVISQFLKEEKDNLNTVNDIP
ncbi:MAG: hypothetical protein K6E76_02625 [Patescibacteria group bacterium]|jgi:hypothetical protein|nr:hypothetical protein [Patescibacteria group bacterium]